MLVGTGQMLGGREVIPSSCMIVIAYTSYSIGTTLKRYHCEFYRFHSFVHIYTWFLFCSVVRIRWPSVTQ